MKGIVFREFIDFVEEALGEDVADDMITDANPSSGGAYTSVGKYDWQELVDMVVALSHITQKPVPDLVASFGHHLFGRFSALYPAFFEGQNDVFAFLESVENHIHVEVKKLYPDAELPKLDTRPDGDGVLVIRYTSCRPFGDLCVGMIEGCAAHFNETVSITHTAHADGLDIRIVREQAAAA
ncbi:heme NO-binding domain-containing protein [Aestuariibius sp. HNIBRBA575]|uniref:heme NO-binding domain-containing protein n=1 Tax=Aestuariibius sp. HNIBRBA575 TaxID=3233343 RepID=UPI0034A0D535